MRTCELYMLFFLRPAGFVFDVYYMFVQVCVLVCVCVRVRCICSFSCVRPAGSSLTCVCVCAYVCMHVCMRVCVHACEYLCVSVLHLCVYLYACVHMHVSLGLPQVHTSTVSHTLKFTQVQLKSGITSI